MFARSSMDVALGQGILRGRPYGGISTFIHKSLTDSLGRINCISCAERFVIVSVGKLLLINVYMPSVRSADDLDELRVIFNEIEAFIVDVDCNYAVMAGDFNSDVRKNDAVSLYINNWMASLNLTLANNLLRIPCTITYTFKAKSRDAKSCIDHFFVSNNPANNLAQSRKDIDSNENFSDHNPIVLTLNNSIYDLCKENIRVENRRRNNVTDKSDIYENILFDWESSSKSDYYNLTRVELNSLCSLFLNSDLTALKSVRPDIFSQNGLNDIYRNVVHFLYNSSLRTIKSKSKKGYNKYWWDSSLNEEKRESKEQFELWCNAGKPTSGPIYDEKCAARKKYRNAIFKKKFESKE